MRVLGGAVALAVGAMMFSCRGQVPLGGQPIGAACIPSQESSTTFLGFDYHEVAVDEGNVACGGGVCLVNHYQGRVTCPYGQNPTADGAYAATGGGAKCGSASPSACCTPGSDQPVLSSQDVGSAMPMHSEVQPGCSDRPSAKAVTCSCRCANAAGKTDDGAQYCTCPSGFACTQVVPELTVGDPRAGAYCIANGSAYDLQHTCTNECDPLQNDCPPPAGGTKASAAGAEATYFVTAVQGAGNHVCLPLALATDAGGMASCIALVSLPAGESCSITPGLTTPDPAIVASVKQTEQALMPQTLCEAPQLSAPCATGTQTGWCYVTSTDGSLGCPSAIEFTTGLPPAGSFVILGCY